MSLYYFFFFFSSRRRHTRYWRDWSSDVCSSDLSRKTMAIPVAGKPRWMAGSGGRKSVKLSRESYKYCEHDQQAERQCPGQLRAKTRRGPVGYPAKLVEQHVDPEANEQTGHDQA